MPTVLGNEFIEYKQSSVSYKILRKLRKGQYNVEAILDLHGKTVEEVSVFLEVFLQHCLSHQMRVVLGIIAVVDDNRVQRNVGPAVDGGNSIDYD